MKINYKAYNVASAVVHPAGGYINRLAGTFIGGSSTTTYLQIHDAKEVPANGTVPLRSWQVSDASPFQQTWIETELTFLNGCVICWSTTENSLTASAETGDIFVEGESPYDNTGYSTAGDLTTADDVLQVWADSAGPKVLKRIEFTKIANAGETVYGLLFTKDSPVAGDVSPFPSIAIPNTESIDARFDEVNLLSQGTGVVSGSIKTNNGTLYDGLTVAISITSGVLTSPEEADTYYAIRVTYK